MRPASCSQLIASREGDFNPGTIIGGRKNTEETKNERTPVDAGGMAPLWWTGVAATCSKVMVQESLQ